MGEEREWEERREEGEGGGGREGFFARRLSFWNPSLPSSPRRWAPILSLLFSFLLRVCVCVKCFFLLFCLSTNRGGKRVGEGFFCLSLYLPLFLLAFLCTFFLFLTHFFEKEESEGFAFSLFAAFFVLAFRMQGWGALLGPEAPGDFDYDGVVRNAGARLVALSRFPFDC